MGESQVSGPQGQAFEITEISEQNYRDLESSEKR